MLGLSKERTSLNRIVTQWNGLDGAIVNAGTGTGTWEIGTAWELRAATSVSKSI